MGHCTSSAELAPASQSLVDATKYRLSPANTHGCTAPSRRLHMCYVCTCSFGFGETQFQVFLLMASRRLAADRFFTAENYNPDTYTQAGLDWIEAATFRGVLQRHVPELQAAGWIIPANAFNPWVPPSPA